MLFYRVTIYFVLFVLLTSIFFVGLSGKSIKLPKSLLFKSNKHIENNNKNNMNKNNLLISMILSLLITVIFIYKKENNL